MNAVATFSNHDVNTQANVYAITEGQFAGRFSAVLVDLDCNQAVGGKIFPALDDAVAYAKTLVA